jgi:hypothetical protein
VEGHGQVPLMASDDLAKAKLLLVTLGGPVSNLVLASAGISLVCLVLKLDVLLWGALIFGLYFFGLAMTYTIMGPALGLLGIRRLFRIIVALEGVAFVLLLAAYLI